MVCRCPSGSRRPCPSVTIARTGHRNRLGLTFVSIKLALVIVPPFALSGWRFFMAAVPLVFFVGRPQVPWRWLGIYAVFIAVGQFAVMFIALNMGMPAGLMSLVVQTQVFFTIGLAVALFGESVLRNQIAGALVATIGLVIIGVSKLQGGVGAAFLLVLLAAFFWAAGNIRWQSTWPASHAAVG